MADKFENTNGASPSTEFERSIARASASNDSSSKAGTKSSPLVDGHGSELKRESNSGADDQLEALKSELENLKRSVATIATTAKGLASERVDVTISDVEEVLKRNVFSSVAVAAFLGYLWGRTR